jgi:hypothetical protein
LLYAKQRGFHPVAFIGSTDATGIASAAVNAELFKSPELRGLELVADERVTTGDVTATAQVAKVKAARPDVLWTSTSGTVFQTVVRALADAGKRRCLPTRSKGSGPSHRRSTHLLGTLLIVMAAYRQFGSTMTAEQVKSFTLAQRHFAGLNGFYNFENGDQHGLDSNSVLIIGWNRMRFHVTRAGTSHRVPHSFGYWHINDLDEIYLAIPAPEGETRGHFVVVMQKPVGKEGESFAWYCEKCLTLFDEHRFNHGQLGLGEFSRAEMEAVAKHNAGDRVCPECGHLNPLAYTWNTVKNTPELKAPRLHW